MHRESPTDAAVTTHPSIITIVTVVPDECAKVVTTEKGIQVNVL